jgi:hypothetical protein
VAVVVVVTLTGALSGALASGTPSRPRIVPASGDWEVGLAPPMNVGEAGWCIDDRRSNGGGFSCDVQVTERQPVVSEDWGASGPPLVSYGYAVTLDRVRAVSVEGGAPIPTRPQPRLPGGLPAVAVEVPGELVFGRLIGPPRFTPLDEHDNPLEGFKRVPRRPPTAHLRFWRAPERRLAGVCGIAVRGVRGLVEKQGTVLTRLEAAPGVVDRGLLICASTYYEKGTWPIRVSVLLDALQPARTAPVAIPGVKPVPGHEGVFGEIAPLQKLLARRRHTAWLLVEGGEGLADRLAVLTHLHATLPKRPR